MPERTIRFSQSDIDAAHRIAKAMFPKPDVVNADDVLRLAAYEGLRQLKVIWHDDDAYADSKIRQDKLDGPRGKDMTTDGLPLKEGE